MNSTPKHRSGTRPDKRSSPYKVVRKRLSSIKPSPENFALYHEIRRDDPDITTLAESIKRKGLHEPLKVTADGWLISGHRRHFAMVLNKQVIAPCFVIPVRRDAMTKSEYTAMLRDHNRQRHKSVVEQVRETLIDINPNDAHRRLTQERDRVYFGGDGGQPLSIEGKKRRHTISDQKADHVKYVLKVVNEDRADYHPLSVRAVHYGLLNYKFMRNLPRNLSYKNDDESYQATSDLITRMRLNGELPWNAFDDGTRPANLPRPFSDVRHYIRQEVRGILTGYWRNLLQTQPDHVEVLCEKNTIYHMVLSITKKYQIPTSSGRGFNSIDPWHDLYQRYRNSRKKRLIVIVMSDYDPEGEMIPQVGGRTLRDDFEVPSKNIDIIKAGVTRNQIKQYELPSQNFAKETSSNYSWFVDRNGGDDSVYELEALNPATMLEDLENVITGVLDVELYNREVEIEEDEAAYLEAARATAVEALKGLGDDHE